MDAQMNSRKSRTSSEYSANVRDLNVKHKAISQGWAKIQEDIIGWFQSMYENIWEATCQEDSFDVYEGISWSRQMMLSVGMLLMRLEFGIVGI